MKMNKSIIGVFLLLLGFSELSYSIDIYDSLYFGNRWRTFMTHLPPTYSTNQHFPVVLVFHGGQSGQVQTQLGWAGIASTSRMSQKSDSSGFVVVYPEGTVIDRNRTWNAGGCCPPAMNLNINDVGYVSILLDTLFRRYTIDTIRVYATGFSNGGLFCYRLACELSNRFAAVAPVAASQMYWGQIPTREIPIITFHSYLDSNVLYQGGIGTGLTGVNFTSQDSTLRYWYLVNHYSRWDTIHNGHGTDYNLIRLSRPGSNSRFDHYATTDGGHSWPGGNRSGDPVSTQVNATDLIWSFFSQYSLLDAPAAFREHGREAEGYHLMISYPNPFNLTTTIRFSIPKSGAVRVMVYDAVGREVCTLVNEKLSAGHHEVRWSGANEVSGVYFTKLVVGTVVDTKKIVLLK